MKKTLLTWQLAGFCIVSLLGTLLHFLYDWSNQNVVIAPFSAVNESTWEHMKILFFPLFAFALVQNKKISLHYENFLCVKTVGILTGVILVPIIFYTANGAFGKTPDWVNILIFFVANAGAFLAEYLLFTKTKGATKCNSKWIPLAILITVALLFVIFTFVPPQIPLFADPTASN